MEGEQTTHQPRAGAEVAAESREVARLEHELVLLSRHFLQRGRLQELDRSAYILLGRLELGEPMSLKEIAAACALDASTINRQVGMLERKGLVERVVDPGGGVARKIRPTALGVERLHADRAVSRDGVQRIVQEWPEERVEVLRRLLWEFNTSIEDLEGRRWPRP